MAIRGGKRGSGEKNSEIPKLHPEHCGHFQKMNGEGVRVFATTGRARGKTNTVLKVCRVGIRDFRKGDTASPFFSKEEERRKEGGKNLVGESGGIMANHERCSV